MDLVEVLSFLLMLSTTELGKVGVHVPFSSLHGSFKLRHMLRAIPPKT